MTKPSYEEPDARAIKTVALELGVDELFKRWKAAEAENLRVRGLLQRQWISVEERLPEDGKIVLAGMVDAFGNWMHVVGYINEGIWRTARVWWKIGAVTHWMPLPMPPSFPQSSSQGAESADIGTDKTGVEREMKIRNEVYRAARLLGAQSDLLCLLGSWGNTLPDEDILDYLKRWNDVTETELEQKAGTE